MGAWRFMDDLADEAATNALNTYVRTRERRTRELEEAELWADEALNFLMVRASHLRQRVEQL